MTATFTDYGAHLPRLQIDQVLPAPVLGFAPNIAAQPTVAASRKRSFGPRVGSTAAEAFPRSRMPRHTSATRKQRSFTDGLANW
jgi:hypothetical protein